MVAIKKRRKTSLAAIPKPIKISLKKSTKKDLDILPPPPPTGIKTKKIKIPPPLETKKSLDIPIPLKETGYDELPPPPPHIPFDIIHSKTDRLLGKELVFKEKKKRRQLKEEERLEEKGIRKQDKELGKEIYALSSALKQHTKTIDKYERLLSEDPEKLIKTDKKRFDQIKQELRSEEEYKNNIKELKKKLNKYNKLANENKTYLKNEIENLKNIYQNYTHKAEGIRKAIFAKLDSIERIRNERGKEAIKNAGEIPKPEKGFLEGLFKRAKEKPFMEKERKRLEKLKEKELKEKSGKGELKLEIEKELEKKTKEFKIPEPEELPEIEELPPIEEPEKELKLPELEELPEIEELPPIEKSKKNIRLPKLDLSAIKKLLPKKKEKPEPEIEEPPKAEEFGTAEPEAFPEAGLPEIEELLPAEEKKTEFPKLDFKKLLQKKAVPEAKIELPIPEETEKERAKREIAKAIEQLKSRKPVELEHEFREDTLYVINQMINDTRDALLNLNIQKAKYIYIEIMRMYNRLDDEKKKRVYEAVKELYDERKAAEAMLNR